MDPALWSTLPSELLAVEVLRRLARTRAGAAKMRLTCRAWRAAANKLWTPPAGWHAAQVDAMMYLRNNIHEGGFGKPRSKYTPAERDLPQRLDFVLRRPGLSRDDATYSPGYHGYSCVTYCLGADGNLEQFRRLADMFGEELWADAADVIVMLALERGHHELLTWACDTYPYQDDDLYEAHAWGLDTALRNGRTEMAQRLLEWAGVEKTCHMLDFCIAEGSSFIVAALGKDDINTLKWLRATHSQVWDDPAADPDLYPSFLEDCLHAACDNENVELVGWELAEGAGAAIEAGVVDPDEALGAALHANNHDILERLCALPSVKADILNAAVRHEAVPALRWLLGAHSYTPDDLYAALKL